MSEMSKSRLETICQFDIELFKFLKEQADRHEEMSMGDVAFVLCKHLAQFVVSEDKSRREGCCKEVLEKIKSVIKTLEMMEEIFGEKSSFSGETLH